MRGFLRHVSSECKRECFMLAMWISEEIGAGKPALASDYR